MISQSPWEASPVVILNIILLQLEASPALYIRSGSCVQGRSGKAMPARASPGRFLPAKLLSPWARHQSPRRVFEIEPFTCFLHCLPPQKSASAIVTVLLKRPLFLLSRTFVYEFTVYVHAGVPSHKLNRYLWICITLGPINTKKRAINGQMNDRNTGGQPKVSKRPTVVKAP